MQSAREYPISAHASQESFRSQPLEGNRDFDERISHAPNEKLNLDNFYAGIKSSAYFLDELSRSGL